MNTVIQVNINTTPFLLNELDHMVDEKIFPSKNDAINEAFHLLIRKYRLEDRKEDRFSKDGYRELPECHRGSSFFT